MVKYPVSGLGKTSHTGGFDIDHVLPFSVWKNNDLWNLLPAKPAINGQKRDLIPHPDLIRSRGMNIRNYWRLMNVYNPNRFYSGLSLSLFGSQDISDDWEEDALGSLCRICQYLIDDRGICHGILEKGDF